MKDMKLGALQHAGQLLQQLGHWQERNPTQSVLHNHHRVIQHTTYLPSLGHLRVWSTVHGGVIGSCGSRMGVTGEKTLPNKAWKL